MRLKSGISFLQAAPLLVLIILIFFCRIPVYADDTSLGRTPEGVFPILEGDVVMESEEITVDMEKNKVECIFVFHNTGKSKPVYMGFPGKIKDPGSELTDAVDLELRNFKTFVKGKVLPVSLEKSVQGNNEDLTAYSEFFTFTVPFKEDERITVRNTYDFTPTYDSLGTVYCGYVLETGAMWKGNIGSARVTFKLGSIKPCQIEKLNPGGFIFDGSNLVWHRTDFEPKYNLRVNYNNYRYTSRFLDDIAGDDKIKQEVNQKVESYGIVKELADRNQTEELLSLYRKAVEEKDAIMALYIRSHLPSGKIPEEKTRIEYVALEKEYGRELARCYTSGPEAAHIQFKISHSENGKIIEDAAEEGITGYSLEYLTPGKAYSISFTLTDWMDRTETKEILYKAPEKEAAASAEESTQSPDTAMASASQTAVSPDSGNSGEPSMDNSEAKNGIDARLIAAILSGVILIGFAVVSAIIIRKNKRVD
ncbi:hypothetical protein LY28_03306 [Ruminiclostridium sufflavum DSM 19573]|uniref:Uncharacterized protein n=1 Tax=Ruminiclostridium sufflavum DSM 19573 TaxID=1121337 RepID=A0A318XIU8_9FIRM|nr:hypothetical protein [Ruminiclostridium sufflavum]PYG85618.1 hypothetical protein LY28_03306 [Ruminiclostridium sufflavum DSM 19573]